MILLLSSLLIARCLATINVGCTGHFGDVLLTAKECHRVAAEFEHVVCTCPTGALPVLTADASLGTFATPTNLWLQGVVPYAVDDALYPEVKAHLERAVPYFNNYTTLEWIPRTSETDYVYFTLSKTTSRCASQVGRVGGRQEVVLKLCNWLEIVHEMLHAIGFWHEQSRPDRDTYINVRSGLEQESVNWLKIKANKWVDLGTAYDYRSLLQYPIFSKWESPFDELDATIPTNFGDASYQKCLRKLTKGTRPKWGYEGGLSWADQKEIVTLYEGTAIKTTYAIAPQNPGRDCARSFCVVAGSAVVGTYQNVEDAKAKLSTYSSGSRMICEMHAWVAGKDARTVGDQDQGAGLAAGFNRLWTDGDDMRRMAAVCEADLACRQSSMDLGRGIYTQPISQSLSRRAANWAFDTLMSLFQ